MAAYTVKGTIDLSGGPNADAVWLYGSYLYVGTSNNSDTLQIIQGDTSGGGGGGGGSENYVALGIFTSQTFDTGSDATAYGKLAWTQRGNGTVKFQLRTAANEAGLGSAVWVGPDGTSNTYYTASGTQISTAPSAAERWVQYQTVLEGSGSETPIIEDITINY